MIGDNERLQNVSKSVPGMPPPVPDRFQNDSGTASERFRPPTWGQDPPLLPALKCSLPVDSWVAILVGGEFVGHVHSIDISSTLVINLREKA